MKIGVDRPHDVASRSIRRLAWPIATIALVIACDNSPTAVRSDGPNDRRPSLAIADDPALNWSDTWISETQTFAETTTVTSSEAFPDPGGSGAMINSITVGSEPQVMNVLAGYGYDGVFRMTTASDRTNYLETNIVRLVGNQPYDESGYQPMTADAIENEPLATLGDLRYMPIDPGGGIGGDGVDDSECVSDPKLCPLEMGAAKGTSAAPALRPRFIRIDATHAEIIKESTMGPVPSGGMPSASMRETRGYEHRGKDWILAHIKNEIDQASPTAKMHHVRHQYIGHVAFARNAKLDAERIKRARDRAKGAADSSGVSMSAPVDRAAQTLAGTTLTCVISVSLRPRDPRALNYCGGGYNGTISSGQPPAPDQAVLSLSDFRWDSPSGGPLIVFQHGFMSSSDTWKRMGYWFRSDQPTAKQFAPSLNWKLHYEDQAAVLRDRISSEVGLLPTIVIGHSNGGMIARNLARNPGAVPVKGIITVGTPHWGAPLGNGGAAVAKALGFGAVGVLVDCYYLGGAGCDLTRQAAAGMAFYYLAFGSSIPVLDEMKYYDGYHAAFNANSEAVQRFAVISEVWGKWGLWRVWGDKSCYGDDPACGGGARVAKIDKVYHHDLTCAAVSGIVSIFYHPSATAALQCGLDAAFLRTFDKLFLKLTVNGEASDGVVPVRSQTFPGIPSENITKLEDGPSHMGETSHPRTRDALNTFIRRVTLR